MSHGLAWRFGSLRNCQFSSYVGSGYLRAGSDVGVWAVAGDAARKADATRTKMQRENISVLLHDAVTQLGNPCSTLESKFPRLKIAKSRFARGPRRLRDAILSGISPLRRLARAASLPASSVQRT